MHAMTAVSSVNQPQNDRKSVVFCKRPARMELFRDAVFLGGLAAPAPTRPDGQPVDLSFQARGVCPPPNDDAIPCKCTVEPYPEIVLELRVSASVRVCVDCSRH